MNIICYLNNIPMTSSQCKLFDLYNEYLQGKVDKNAFINFEGYGNMFPVAEELYNKIMGR